MVVLIATPYSTPCQDTYKRKATIMCANCGGYGHLYKSCNHPVISYGIICYKLVFNNSTNSYEPHFLMIQRKDSLSYVEFIRGKYNLENRKYIMKLFSNMTGEERIRIKSLDFDTLWKNMWCKPTEEETNKNFTKEYCESAVKFNVLKKGYLLKTEEDGIISFSLSHLLDKTDATYEETEWGFPKGRRNINEDDISCALREFREESGVHLKCIRLLNDVKPLEEVFSGSNKIRYKHVYYLARYVSDCFDTLLNCKEVRDVKWFSYDEMMEKIRPYNVERKELAKRAMIVIMKRLYPQTVPKLEAN